MRLMSILTAVFPLFVSLGALTAADGPIRPRATQPAAAASIRVGVNMALVPVTVLDEAGRNVTGLAPGNFRVIDGSTPRPIASFSLEDQPVSVGLVFDCSGSMREKFLTAREAPAELYKQLNEGDESFLITVSDSPVLRQKLTSNLEEIQNALVFTHPTGATSLVDSVYLGLAQLKMAHNPRKALIVVSDGGDNNSRYTQRELTNIARESDAQIFTIGLHRNPRTGEEIAGPELMEDLARSSGGINYRVSDMNRLRVVMSQIGVTLHNQYVLGYYPPPDARGGKYHKIKVQLLLPLGLPPLRIFARAGYYAPEN
jgi:Ca-activated chloride channel family protein